MKNQESRALRVMTALEGHHLGDTSTVREDFEEIKLAIRLEQVPEKNRNMKPFFRLILGIGAQAMQQLTGINIICYYLPYVLTESVGLEGSTARLLAAVNAMTYLASTLIGFYFIEKWGRRILLIAGAVGQCCCWLAITILLNFAHREAPDSPQEVKLGSIAVAFFFLFNCFFGAGWQGVSWLYPTEINSTRYRISGMSYGVATNWLINFAVVFITPLGIAKLGSQFYVIWTVLNGLMVPIIYLFYPETSGRSLEDIDRMFEAHPSVWVFTHPSMISRRPPPNFSRRSSRAMNNETELDDMPTPITVEHAKLAQRPASGPPSQIDIRSEPGVRFRGSDAHPGSLIENSLTEDTGLTSTTTLAYTETQPSLGPQVSTTPLIT